VCTVDGYDQKELVKNVTLDAPGKVIQLLFSKNSTQGGVSPYEDYPYSITVGVANAWTEIGNDDYKMDTLSIKNTPANASEPYGSVARTNVELKLYNSLTSNVLNNGMNKDSIFTISAKNVPLDKIDEELQNADEWFSVVQLHCTPDGAKFGSYPAKTVVTNKYFEKEMSFRCIGAKNNAVSVPAKGGSASLEFEHFSDYDIETRAIVEFKDETTVTVTQSYLAVNVGTYDYEYVVYSGYTCDYSGKNGFIDKYLNAKFGSKKHTTTRYVQITNMSAKASVPYVTYQKLKRYFVYFGDLKVEVFVYGEDEINIDYENAVPWTDVRHSGLSAE
jgi:hypothetical protein